MRFVLEIAQLSVKIERERVERFHSTNYSTYIITDITYYLNIQKTVFSKWMAEYPHQLPITSIALLHIR